MKIFMVIITGCFKIISTNVQKRKDTPRPAKIPTQFMLVTQAVKRKMPLFFLLKAEIPHYKQIRPAF